MSQVTACPQGAPGPHLTLLENKGLSHEACAVISVTALQEESLLYPTVYGGVAHLLP